jgi:chromosomal replication initiation ATPase DnaA
MRAHENYIIETTDPRFTLVMFLKSRSRALGTYHNLIVKTTPVDVYLKMIEKITGVSRFKFLGKCRKWEYIYAKKMYAVLVYKKTGWSLHEVERQTYIDHSTVANARKTISHEYISNYRMARAWINKLSYMSGLSVDFLVQYRDM